MKSEEPGRQQLSRRDFGAPHSVRPNKGNVGNSVGKCCHFMIFLVIVSATYRGNQHYGASISNMSSVGIATSATDFTNTSATITGIADITTTIVK